jgi:HK97 family phage prohead protease
MTDKSARASVTGIVRRAYPVHLEARAKDGASGVSTVSGYASVVEEPYEMWDFLGSYAEVVRTGAFTKTLSETPQVQLLLNHGGLAMAYTKAGTLRLSEDSTGLHMEADVTAARSDVQDMLLALEDGSVDEMSFAFRVTRQMWSPDYDQRDILEVDLHRGDVSVVNFGANPATSVQPALRAADFDKLGDDDARALYERLQRRLSPPGVPKPTAGHPLSLYQAQAAALAL